MLLFQKEYGSIAIVDLKKTPFFREVFFLNLFFVL